MKVLGRKSFPIWTCQIDVEVGPMLRNGFVAAVLNLNHARCSSTEEMFKCKAAWRPPSLGSGNMQVKCACSLYMPSMAHAKYLGGKSLE